MKQRFHKSRNTVKAFIQELVLPELITSVCHFVFFCSCLGVSNVKWSDNRRSHCFQRVRCSWNVFLAHTKHVWAVMLCHGSCWLLPPGGRDWGGPAEGWLTWTARHCVHLGVCCIHLTNPFPCVTGAQNTNSWKGKLSLLNSLRKSCKMEVLFLVVLGMRNFANQSSSPRAHGEDMAHPCCFHMAFIIECSGGCKSNPGVTLLWPAQHFLPPPWSWCKTYMSGMVCCGATLDQGGIWLQFQQGMKFCMQSWGLGVYRNTEIHSCLCVCLQTKCRGFFKEKCPNSCMFFIRRRGRAKLQSCGCIGKLSHV